MRGRNLLLCIVLATAGAMPVRAGIIFNRKPKPNPNQYVVQMIFALKTDKDDGKRANAAEELRNFDAAQFPEIVPALTEAALRDSAAGVRAEAIHSLGKLRPISQEVGAVFEQAVANDSSVRVQVQARAALLGYRIAGYRSAKNAETPAAPRKIKTEEPPLADAPAAVTSAVSVPAPTAAAAPTKEPRRIFNVARPKAATQPAPQTPEKQAPAKQVEEGPVLTPPK